MPSALTLAGHALLAAAVPPLAPTGFVRSPNAAGLREALRKLSNATTPAPRPAH